MIEEKREESWKFRLGGWGTSGSGILAECKVHAWTRLKKRAGMIGADHIYMGQRVQDRVVMGPLGPSLRTGTIVFQAHHIHGPDIIPSCKPATYTYLSLFTP